MRIHVSRVAMGLLLIIALLAGCAPATGAPTPGGIPSAPVEPAKAVVQDSFSICFVTSMEADFLKDFRFVMGHLQSLLRQEGWTVELRVEPMSPQEEGANDEFLLNIYRQLSASGQAPDAYPVDPLSAKRLRAAGITQDLSAVIPRAAPVIYESCKPLFAGAVDGIPMSMGTGSGSGPMALLMSTEELNAYGQPIGSAEDILTFLEERTEVSVGAEETQLWDAWAAQKGYYALYNYGLPLFFYARADDAACTPVPLEDIDGFADFYLRQLALREAGRLGHYLELRGKKVGMLSTLRMDAGPELQRQTGLAGKDTTALLLQGCTVEKRVLTASTDEAYIGAMLAVDAASDRADTVAAFAQWILTDPEGYSLCSYGQKDVDYRMVGDRIEFLNAGAELKPVDIAENLSSPAFFRYHGILVYNSDLERLNAYVASNIEQAMDQSKPVEPPIWRTLLMKVKQRREIFDTLTQPYDELLGQRYMDLGYSVNRTNNEFTAEQVLARIMDNRPKLSPMIEGLSQQLKDMLAKSPG